MSRPIPELLAVGLLAVVGAACGDDSKGLATFCAEATRVLNEPEYPSDGAGVAAALRSIDVSSLDGIARSSFAESIDNLESRIADFNKGDAPDGWSTQGPAVLASRFCDANIEIFNVMPTVP
jgi:hypothetical protein